MIPLVIEGDAQSITVTLNALVDNCPHEVEHFIP